MSTKLRIAGFILALLLTGSFAWAGGSGESSPEKDAPIVSTAGESGLASAAEKLGITEVELREALGDPSQGPPNIPEAAERLGVSESVLEEVMREMDKEESMEVEAHTIVLNGIEFTIRYQVFTWDDLPSDVQYQRQPVQSFTDDNNVTHYYEAVYVESGNLNWYQAAYLAEEAGGYLACPGTEEENQFIFSLINDKKYFWFFDENGKHYGISIGPFLGGFQPEGSAEPAGGWRWLSGEDWEYTDWAQNLDDGLIDKDPRDNTQPNDSGDGQPIMGFGEMNLPVPTWGDYMENVGTYGLKRSPGQSYGFIIEYEDNPR